MLAVHSALQSIAIGPASSPEDDVDNSGSSTLGRRSPSCDCYNWIKACRESPHSRSTACRRDWSASAPAYQQSLPAFPVPRSSTVRLQLRPHRLQELRNTDNMARHRASDGKVSLARGRISESDVSSSRCNSTRAARPQPVQCDTVRAAAALLTRVAPL